MEIKLKINNNNYEMCFVNPDNENLKMDDGEYHSGVTDFITKKIYIRNMLGEDSLRYTIIHELTHAIIDSYGFLQVEWNDEIVADFMANYIFVLSDLTEKINNYSKSKLRRKTNDRFML